MDDSISSYIVRARKALDSIRIKRQFIDQELEVLRTENTRLWAEKIKSSPTSPDGITVRRRDSLRLRRSSLRMSFSFKEVHTETPREKLQDLETSVQLQAQITGALNTGTAIDMWMRRQHCELHILLAHNGRVNETTLTASQEDWGMLKLWADIKKVPDKN